MIYLRQQVRGKSVWQRLNVYGKCRMSRGRLWRSSKSQRACACLPLPLNFQAGQRLLCAYSGLNIPGKGKTWGICLITCSVVKTNTHRPRKDLQVLKQGRDLDENSVFLLPGIFVCLEKACEADRHIFLLWGKDVLQRTKEGLLRGK